MDIQRSLCAPAHCLKLLSILKNNDKQGANFARIQSWVKAVNGGVQKLTEDFGDCPDIIDPFTMALTMASDCAYCVGIACVQFNNVPDGSRNWILVHHQELSRGRTSGMMNALWVMPGQINICALQLHVVF